MRGVHDDGFALDDSFLNGNLNGLSDQHIQKGRILQPELAEFGQRTWINGGTPIVGAIFADQFFIDKGKVHQIIKFKVWA